jgi:hypothetical protein
MQGDERADVERLRRYWDGVVQGTPTNADDLDAASTAVVRRLHELYQPPLPDPAFRQRLQEEYMNATTVQPRIATPPTGDDRATSPNSWTAPVPYHRSPPPWFFADRGRVLSHLATAALLLLTLVSAYRLFVAPHGGGPSEPRTTLPAVASTPAPTLPPGVKEDTIVFQQVLDELPVYAQWAGVGRTTVAPGATMSIGAGEPAGFGPDVLTVERGSVTGQVEGPVELTPAGATRPIAVPKHTDVVLNPGDVAYIPYGYTSHWRNDGAVPASLLDAGVGLPAGDLPEPGVTHETAPIAGWPNMFDMPQAPVELIVHRMTVEPGWSLAGEPGPGLHLVGVDAGTLTITWALRTDPMASPGTSQLQPGDWKDLTNPLIANGKHEVAKELRNDGTAPLVLWLMTVTPLGTGAATPAA